MSEQSSAKEAGYKYLLTYQYSSVIYDFTAEFCARFLPGRELMRQRDQMIQAARSGKQNIAEGSQTSGTSKKTELKLVNVARASLEELLLDYEDFLRQHGLPLWSKDDTRAHEVRALAYKSNRTNETYAGFLRKPEEAANMLICLIHQANYLLDQQIAALEKEFLEKGGFSENLYHQRREEKKKQLAKNSFSYLKKEKEK